MIIAPHSNDNCIGAGGLMSLYPELCNVIVLTDGRQGQKNVVPEKVKVKRRQEFEQEMKYFRIRYYKML